MSFFSKKTELGIVFHIASSSVGTGLVRYEEGKEPYVLYTAREVIPFREKVDPERLVSDMLDALKRTNYRLAKFGLSHHISTGEIKHVSYAFSSPWSAAQTKVVTVKEDREFLVTKKQIDRIVETHEKVGSKSSGLEAIEKRVIEVKLDGVPDPEPYGKRAKEIEISVFISHVPKAILRKVFDVSVSTYHPKNTNVFSFPLVAFSTIRDLFHHEMDFAFLEVGGEISEVSAVKSGLIIETASFPLGTHFPVRKVRGMFGISAEEASSFIRLYEEERADEDFRRKMGSIIKDCAEEWKTALHAALSRMYGGEKLSVPLYAVINNDLSKFFMKAIRGEHKVGYSKSTGITSSVTLMTPERLKGAVRFDKHADADAAIAFVAAFSGRIRPIE